MPRLSHSEALLGPEVFKQIRETPVLVVGAGGIGCELLKNLVLVGFANIEIIDLDTIDLSNLNRQFLFRKPDISKSKALVAAASARHFNPSSGINIHARHGNVKEAQNDLEWIKGFGLVMNALDNMDARRHVNRLCQAAGVPLMESGTAGYLGQVTPILRDQTECFDCVPKPTPKSFPVCTIRATPSEPIHCIVWAKTYLFGKLFGEDDEETDSAELDKAQASGENAQEIEELKREAKAFREVRRNLGEEDGPRAVFSKVFWDDINRLLAMEDMWKVAGRVKPVALDYDTIMKGDFVAPPLRAAPQTNGAKKEESANASSEAEGQTPALNGASTSSNGASNGSASTSQKLRDQKELSVKENLELFVDRLSARAIANPNVVLSFDKDDDDTLDFVLATANLRAIAYGIANKTRFQVKEMAGNIIPAIATTNAIIAGFVVMQATNLLARNLKNARKVFLKANPAFPLGLERPAQPDPACGVCRDTYISLKADPARLTLGTFVNDIVQKWLVEGGKGDANGGDEADDDDEDFFQIYESGRLLAEPDFEDNYERTLENMDAGRGKVLTVRDEDGKYRPVQFYITALDEGASETYILPDTRPTLTVAPAKPKVREESPDDIVALDEAPANSTQQPIASGATTTRKRGAPEDGDVAVGEDEDGAAKKRKLASGNEVIEID